MMAQEVQRNEYQEPTTLDSRSEVAGHRRGPSNAAISQRSMSSSRHSSRPVLRLGEEGASGGLGGFERRERRAQVEQPGSATGDRDHASTGSGERTERREPGAKKGALAITPHRRYRAEEKALILETVCQAQARTGEPIETILTQLGFPSATYYRWQVREGDGQLADAVVVPHRRVPLPTPEELIAVRSFALATPQMGYKRLTWMMIDEDVAYLRPWQVYDILSKHDLLRQSTQSVSKPLKRPPEPGHPDQVWHVDIMYLYIQPRYYYLVDILDGYSRFLVHWSLNLTMTADTVTFTVQEALEGLSQRRLGEPKIVHDHGSQFLSAEWRRFVAGAEVTDILTRVSHPQSNGRLERLHRTHREEGLTEEDLGDYYRALEGMERWSHYYNNKRPHSALQYLRPVDYYRGDPAARLAERKQKLAQALVARELYWQVIGNVKELQNLSLK